MLRRIFVKMHESIWFIPSVYSILASLLALGTVLIDTTFNTELKAYIPIYLRTSVDLAQTILSTISGALLTMTTITFSTIMVVLTMYSSQFSPRTLQNFLNAPSTQRVLGLFMGGFVYSILSLLFMRKQSLSNEVISSSVAVIIALICLAFFAYFIHNVGTSIQVSRLIRDLTNDVLLTLDQEKKKANEDNVLSMKEKPLFVQTYARITEIQSPTFGYVQYIDDRKLAEWATMNEVVIDITTPVGTFAGTQSHLVRMYHNDEPPNCNISAYFTLGEERSTIQDIEYGIEKIVEIGLRALSPGINDPNTAIRCIHAIGEVLQQISSLPGGISVTYTKKDKPCLVNTQPKMIDYLYTAFSQISFYGKDDPSVLLAMFDALIYIACSRTSSPEIKQNVRQMGDYIWSRFNKTVLEPLDTERLEIKKQELHTSTTIEKDTFALSKYTSQEMN